MGCPEEMFKPFFSCRIIHTLVQVVGRVLGCVVGREAYQPPTTTPSRHWLGEISICLHV